MKTILYAFLFIAPNIFLSDSSESRSCSLKKLQLPGLGAVPQQAETHPFRGKRNGWVFAFCNTNALLASSLARILPSH